MHLMGVCLIAIGQVAIEAWLFYIRRKVGILISPLTIPNDVKKYNYYPINKTITLSIS